MLDRLEMEFIVKKRLAIIVTAAVLICVFGVYRLFYSPLIKEVKAKYSECKECEDNALYARNLIRSVEITGVKKAVLTEEDISLAIDELTKIGKLKGVDFISITPKEAQKKKELQYEVLPIEMEIKSTYEELGVFLGSLDKLENSLITVSSFKVIPYKGEDLRSLMTELVVEMYLLGKKYAE